MNLLNQDNIVHAALNKTGDIIIANLLFILCSIPLITVGPSLTALYHCTLRTVKGNNNGTARTFFRAFKQNFFQSLAIWICICILGGILFLNLGFLRQVHSFYGELLFYLSFVISMVLAAIALYIFPVLAAFSNTTKNLLKNAFIFACSHLPSTIAMAVITTLPMYMAYQDLKLLPLYAFCWFFFGFGLTAYINSMILYRIFKPYLSSLK